MVFFSTTHLNEIFSFFRLSGLKNIQERFDHKTRTTNQNDERKRKEKHRER